MNRKCLVLLPSFLSMIISHHCFSFSPSQECRSVCLWGLCALHGISVVSACQFVAGHLRNAGEGDGHHCVWSVCGLRRPGALPQTSHPVSTWGFSLFIVCSSSWFLWQSAADCAQFFQPMLGLTVYVHGWTLPLIAAHCKRTDNIVCADSWDMKDRLCIYQCVCGCLCTFILYHLCQSSTFSIFRPDQQNKGELLQQRLS